ncbi:D-ribose transporter subunit; periplasmic-binding compoent of ABC superfamily [uncultured Spirochaetota bacterium]|jgi:ribose transport system substrate-binding protein|nr:D-ribose transporter subunit; periplasmic-binding compoent of ABC superfamily [uncultured Spirochaetota bacterium]
MKRILAALTAVLLCAALLAGCGRDAKASAKKIGLAISTLNNPFFVTLKDGASAKATELGYELVVTDAQDDPAKQAGQVDDLIQKKVAVILINPCNSDAAKTMVEKAAKAGIPVISVDRGVNGAEVLSHIASDNVAGGVLAGQELLALVGEGAKVVELEGIPGASAAVDRGKGFNEAVVGKLNVVARQPADFNRDKGFTVMQNIIQANKDIRGVFAHNDEMALGAIKALEAAGLKDVIVIGFDAVDDAVAAVKAGNMKATVAQKPSLIGSMAVETAVAHIKGEAVQKQIPVPLELVK